MLPPCPCHISSLLIFLSSHSLLFQNPAWPGTRSQLCRTSAPKSHMLLTSIVLTYSALRGSLSRPLLPPCHDCLTSFPEHFWGQDLPVLHAFGSLPVKGRRPLGAHGPASSWHLIGFCTWDHPPPEFAPFKKCSLVFLFNKKAPPFY